VVFVPLPLLSPSPPGSAASSFREFWSLLTSPSNLLLFPPLHTLFMDTFYCDFMFVKTPFFPPWQLLYRVCFVCALAHHSFVVGPSFLSVVFASDKRHTFFFAYFSLHEALHHPSISCTLLAASLRFLMRGVALDDIQRFRIPSLQY